MPCPTLARCRLDCRHRAFVLDYHRERLGQEISAEQEIPPREPEEVRASLWTFRRWLTAHRGMSDSIRMGAPDGEPTFGGAPIPEGGPNSLYGPLSLVEEEISGAA